MKIGIISDTHDDVKYTKLAIEIFKKEGADYVFHLGDFVSPPIVRLFKGIKLIAVFGNNDGYKFVLSKAFNEIDGEIKGDFGIVEVDGLKTALYHGEYAEISEALARSGQYDVVFTGHWHTSSMQKFGNTLWISVGSAKKEFAENNRPIVGIFETKTKKIEFVDIN